MKRILITLTILMTTVVLPAQDSTTVDDHRRKIKIFLDCMSCDTDYLSENLSVVSFVTEPSVADIHLIVSQMSTGSGSIATSMVFAGKKRFQNLRDTVTFSTAPEMTLEEKRMLYLEKMQLGLVPYIMKTENAGRLMLLIGDAFYQEEAEERDSWRDWVFELTGMGSVFNQKNYENYNLNLGLNITRINERYKLESYNMFDYNESKFRYSYFDSLLNNEETIHYNSVQRGFMSNNLFVRNLGDHFGVGGIAMIRSDHPNNMSLRVQTGPAIEYNIFPYDESLQKQFRFMYSVLYEHTEYLEPTIFDKMVDDGWKQRLTIMARFSNTWGYLDAAVSGSAYVEDINKYAIGANLFGSVRLFKGVSATISCGLDMYRDRINQAKGFASFNEILTRQKEMATDYQYNFSVGISYRFGSKKLPPVNPRFRY